MRQYFIEATPTATRRGVTFSRPRAVSKTATKVGTWYLASDDGTPYTFESSTPYGIKFDRAVYNSWNFKTAQQFCITSDGTIVVRRLTTA
jgi:hypothetical protein